MIKKVTVLILVLSLLVGCNSTIKNECNDSNLTKNRNNEFFKIVNNINKTRSKEIQKFVNYDTKLYSKYNDQLNMFSDEEIQNIISPKYPKDVSKGEALDDVETLFKIFKNSYGAYIYLGGDTVFDNAKTNVIKDINNLQSEMIKYTDLVDILVDNLSFLKDGHLKIQGKPTCEKKTMYSSNYEIEIKNNIFYLVENSQKYKIISLNGDKNLQNYVKPTIDSNGKIYYNIFTFFETYEEACNNNKVTIEKDNSEVTKYVSWEKSHNLSFCFSKPYQKDIIDDINVYRLSDLSNNPKNLSDFSKTAYEAKKEKVFVLDIRNNGGGSDAYVHDWFENYNNNKCNIKYTILSKNTPLISASLIQAYNSPSLIDFKGMKEEIERLKTMKYTGEYEKYTSKGTWFKNDSIIIVLINNNVASSGESVITTLRNMENVIFIGSNTAGCTLVSQQTKKYLPNSGICLYSGSNLCLYSDSNTDATGFYPDIYGNPEDALDLAIKLCKYYKLNE